MDINAKELYVEETDKWRERTVIVNVYIDDSGYIYLMSYLCDIYIFSSALKDLKLNFYHWLSQRLLYAITRHIFFNPASCTSWQQLLGISF